MFYLVLFAKFGSVILNQEPFSSEQECQQAGVQYAAMIVEQKSDDRHSAKMGCVEVPAQMPQPRELWDL